MTRNYLTGTNNRRYLFSTADGELITEVGTNTFSLRGGIVSSHYNGQYRYDATGEVIVLRDSTIAAVLPDFDPDFTVADCDLQDVKVKKENGDYKLLFMEAGGGILNEGTELFEDPCGTVAAADAVYYLGKYMLTIAGGLVASVEVAPPNDPNGDLEEAVVRVVSDKTKVGSDDVNDYERKVIVYVAENPKNLTQVGTKVWIDAAGTKPASWERVLFAEKYFSILNAGEVIRVVDTTAEATDDTKKKR